MQLLWMITALSCIKGVLGAESSNLWEKMRQEIPEGGTNPEARFKVQGMLGEGSYGKVFEALDQDDHGRKVAVKVLSLEKAFNDPVEAELLIKEVKVMRSLNHPNVVKFFDAFTWGEDLFIVMEKLDGDLNAFGRPMHEARLSAITKQLLDGLVYLHGKDLLHRDIKPENILYDEANGLVKFADFGQSRFIGKGDGLATSQVGTFPFMSLEQQLGRPYGKATDIWSLGILIMYMGTGELPPPFKNSPFQLSDIMLDPDTSPEFVRFLEVCLELNAQRRLTARELLGMEFITKHAGFDLRDNFFSKYTPAEEEDPDRDEHAYDNDD